MTGDSVYLLVSNFIAQAFHRFTPQIFAVDTSFYQANCRKTIHLAVVSMDSR